MEFNCLIKSENASQNSSRPAMEFNCLIKSEDSSQNSSRPAMEFNCLIKSEDSSQNSSRPAMEFHCLKTEKDGSQNSSRPAMGFNCLKSEKDASSQCNFFLMNKPKTKIKSVQCNFDKKSGTEVQKEQKSNRTLQRFKSVSTQCFTYPVIPVVTIPTKSTKEKVFKADKSTNIDIKTKSKSTTTEPMTVGTLICDISKMINSDYHEVLNYDVKCDCRNQPILRITRKHGIGLIHQETPLEPLELLISEAGQCNLYILFKTAQTYQLKLENQAIDFEKLQNLLDTISGRLGHIFCPGVNKAKIETETSMANFHLPKSLTTFNYPFTRYQAKRCEVFYQYFERNIHKQPKSKQCKFCVATNSEICSAKRRKACETPTQKYKRLRISSNYPMKFLSPSNQKERLSRVQKSRFQLKRKVSSLEKKLEIQQLELSELRSVLSVSQEI